MSLRVTLYSKAECHLCDQAKADLEGLQKEIPHELYVVDIESDPDLEAQYGPRIPVVEAGTYTVEAPFDRKKLKMILGAARDREEQIEQYADPRLKYRDKRRSQMSAGDRLSFFIADRYLLLLNLFLALYVGLPFLAPVLLKIGAEPIARPIYSLYGFTCHQMAFRSWFLFGEQPVYPRASAGVEGYATYGEVTGMSEEDTGEAYLAARVFLGNEQLGYKVAICERDIAIYAAMFLFGILFWMSKERIPGLGWIWWIVIGLGPIALDGFSQLLSQQFPQYVFWAYRESTPFLRTLTGGLFGFTTAWFGFPEVKRTMDDTRKILVNKMARLGELPRKD